MYPKPAHTITALPGDGIGPEVMNAAIQTISATGVEIDWEVVGTEEDASEREVGALPEGAIESVRRTGVALKGPFTTSAHAAHGSPNVALRRILDLHTTIRPSRTLGADGQGRPGADLVVVKMNHEDLYSRIGFEEGSDTARSIDDLLRQEGHPVGPETAYSIKPISVLEVRRVAQAAFEFAAANGRSRVTIVHKASLIPHTDGLFLDVARDVGLSYPDLEVDDALVDTVCERIVAKPGSYDVLVMARMYGDIVSGVAAAKVGGVGVAPGVNIGESCAVFEAAHGSAPRLAGSNRANPMALILSGAMLLRHLGEDEAADRLARAVDRVVSEAQTLTYDLAPPGRASTTSEVAEAVIEKL